MSVTTGTDPSHPVEMQSDMLSTWLHIKAKEQSWEGTFFFLFGSTAVEIRKEKPSSGGSLWWTSVGMMVWEDLMVFYVSCRSPLSYFVSVLLNRKCIHSRRRGAGCVKLISKPSCKVNNALVRKCKYIFCCVQLRSYSRYNCISDSRFWFPSVFFCWCVSVRVSLRAHLSGGLKWCLSSGRIRGLLKSLPLV